MYNETRIILGLSVLILAVSATLTFKNRLFSSKKKLPSTPLVQQVAQPIPMPEREVAQAPPEPVPTETPIAPTPPPEPAPETLKTLKTPKPSAPKAPPKEKPLPETPFLEENSKIDPVMPPPDPELYSSVPSVKPSTLDWFRFEAGPAYLTLQQLDSVFSETRTVTNPLALGIGLGSQINKTMGLELLWSQSLTSNVSSENNIPKNQLAVGFCWQPLATVKGSHYTRWSLGLHTEDSSYLTGDPSFSQITSYSKNSIYGSVVHNRQISNKFYFDLRLLFTTAPFKPSNFSKFTESATQMEVMPQYAVDKTLRLGMNLGVSSRRQRAELTNYLQEKETSNINQQEVKAGLAIISYF